MGGFFVLLGRRQSGIPTSGLRFALRGSAEHGFFLLVGNRLAFLQYSPLYNQTFGFADTFCFPKAPLKMPQNADFLFRKYVSPFR